MNDFRINTNGQYTSEKLHKGNRNKGSANYIFLVHTFVYRKYTTQAGVVAHACNPALWEAKVDCLTSEV